MSAQVELVRSEARLMTREPMATFWVIAFPTALLGVFALIPTFRDRVPELGGQTVLDLYVPINVTLALGFLGLFIIPGALATYRERGVLRRLATTPVGPARVVLAQLAVAAVVGVVGVSLLLAVAWGLLGTVVPVDVLPFAAALLLGLLAMLSVGVLVGALSGTAKAATIAGNVLFFPMMFLAGLYVPVAVLGETMQRIGELTPLGASALVMQRAAVGDPVGTLPFVAMALWTLVPLAVAVRRFRWE
ncbi:ABC transporter permease [Kineococcus glutinatus]|uniref:Transport permease protein n=1 Tax=Kineococcus glutinatus TaxID=1070872 RepID=A0ABP8VD49_9ACTN